MSNLWMAPAVIAACVLAVATPADAQAGNAPHWTGQAAVATASVVVGGRFVALLGPAGGFTPQTRAQQLRLALERQATPANLATFGPRDVAVAMVGGAPVITWRGAHLVTVTGMDARLAASDARTVADGWSHELREAIAGLRVANVGGGGGGGGGRALAGFVAIVPGTAFLPPAGYVGW